MNNRINIRYFITHYQPIYTGAGKSLEKLINALDKNKYNIEIVTAYKKGLKRKEVKNGYTITRLGNGFFDDSGYLNSTGRFDFSIAAAIYNLKNTNYDILKFIGVGKISLLSILIAKIKKKPIVNKITAVGDDDPKKLSKSLIGKIIIKLLQNKAAHWIISKEIYDLCVKYTKWDKNSLYLIPNTVNIPYKSYVELQIKRQKYRNHNNKVNFLFVGVMDKRKGVHILLDLWNKNQFNATLTLCGPLGLDDDVNEMLESNTNENVKYLGEIAPDDIKKEFLKSDFFIFPSIREGLPNVVLESMSMGVPVISNTISGVTDYLIGKNNERGILITNNDLNQWEIEINNCITGMYNYDKMASDAYDWVVNNASYNGVQKKMDEMYLKLLEHD